MTTQSIANLIIQYRYAILIPAAIIEGPIVAFISGTLASLGYFNIYVLAVFFFARDMAMDGIYYAAGFFGARTAFAKRMLKKLDMQEQALSDLRRVWEEHPAKTMFIGKLSYGIAQTFII